MEKRQPRKTRESPFQCQKVLAGGHGVSTASWITIVIGLISMSNA